MPGGDFPSRKGVLDSMLSGCIPITFHPYTAVRQWPFHWKYVEVAENSIIQIDREEMILNPKKIFEDLINLSKNMTFVFNKRSQIAKIGHKFQYKHADSDMHSNKSFLARPDALDITLSRIIFKNKQLKFD